MKRIGLVFVVVLLLVSVASLAQTVQINPGGAQIIPGLIPSLLPTHCFDASCCGFGALAPGPIGPVFFTCGLIFVGQPLPGYATNLEIIDLYPADGINELWLSTGTFYIIFPQSVDCVEIFYTHYCWGEFRAMNSSGGIVAAATFDPAQGIATSAVLNGAGISYVEIDGCELSMTNVCFSD